MNSTERNIPQLARYVGITHDTFNFRLEDVQEKLNHLNMYKTTGPDLLPQRVLRTLEDMLWHVFKWKDIFNKSAETGIIPEGWKSDHVTAIHKKGNRQDWKLHIN